MEFFYIEIWFTVPNSKALDTEDKTNIALVIIDTEDKINIALVINWNVKYKDGTLFNST